MNSAQNDQDRKEQLDQLCKKHYHQIHDLASEDPSLMVNDTDRIVEILESKLPAYGGELDDEDFLAWAADIIKVTIARFAYFYQLRKKYRRNVFAGIWPILHKNWDLTYRTDAAFIAHQIEADTMWWVWQHLDELMVPGTAKMSTRLQSRGKLDAMTWRKTRLRQKARFDCDVDVTGFGLAETDESPLFFDPNHANEAEIDQSARLPKRRPTPASSDSLLAMKSDVPRLLCRSCGSLRVISPDAPSERDEVRLSCGHERPASLPKTA